MVFSWFLAVWAATGYFCQTKFIWGGGGNGFLYNQNWLQINSVYSTERVQNDLWSKETFLEIFLDKSWPLNSRIMKINQTDSHPLIDLSLKGTHLPLMHLFVLIYFLWSSKIWVLEVCAILLWPNKNAEKLSAKQLRRDECSADLHVIFSSGYIRTAPLRSTTHVRSPAPSWVSVNFMLNYWTYEFYLWNSFFYKYDVLILKVVVFKMNVFWADHLPEWNRRSLDDISVEVRGPDICRHSFDEIHNV